ncbi:unnamed protein product [Vitrella brassicaformis CCMP3155]|uniref:Nucleoplasmin-like domain-containing protein n=2 Tax=Vitrella brassicaformis TaxID=1169539 RepID=A0A0G4H4H1_VITBC|nr:unnamed protein product [Vitrella brassicaformis CCMP3155]|eukprot:CEM38417.1 unnamed protein product [Vitrella brassicaformis CCMP3155]
MMFQGLVLKPGETKAVPGDSDDIFEMQQLCLDNPTDGRNYLCVVERKDGKDTNYRCAFLEKGKIEYTGVTLYLRGGAGLSLHNSGKSAIHVCGSLSPMVKFAPFAGAGGAGLADEGKALLGMMAARRAAAAEGEEDDDDDDDEDEDEDEETTEAIKKIIDQMPDRKGATKAKAKAKPSLPTPKPKAAKPQPPLAMDEDEDEDEGDEDMGVAVQRKGGPAAMDEDEDEDAEDEEDEEPPKKAQPKAKAHAKPKAKEAAKPAAASIKRKTEGQPQQQQPQEKKPRVAAGAAGAGAAAAGGGDAEQQFVSELANFIGSQDGQKANMSLLGARVKKPDGVKDKISQIIKRHTDMFVLSTDGKQMVSLKK